MSAPVEAKVKAATAATFLASLVVALLNSVVADNSLLQPLPQWFQAVVIALAPTLITFISAWATQHTPREPSEE